MKSLKDRILFALSARNKTQAELANLIGVKQQSIQQICSGRTKKSRYLYEIANALQVNPEWLTTGKGSFELDLTIPPYISGKLTKLPILTLQQIDLWINNKLDSTQLKNIRYYFTFCDGSARAYALIVESDSMNNPYGWPSIPENSIIVVDPDIKTNLENHTIIIVKSSPAGNKIIREYIKEGDETYLKPLNPRYPISTIDPEKATIYGKVIKIEMDLNNDINKEVATG